MSNDDFYTQMLQISCKLVRVLEKVERGQFDQAEAVEALNTMRLLLHKNQIDYNNIS